jgi:Domain of unknown function (DUF4382)
MTIDIIKLKNVSQLLCGQSFQPDTITNVRLSVSSANATIDTMGFQNLSVPSGKLEVPLGPLAEIQAGKTTTVTVDFQPHIVCQGSGGCKLTPVLHAASTSPA